MDLESSGLTPIDVAFMQSVMLNAHLPKCIETEVYLVTSSEDEFMSCYLEKMEKNKEGRYQRSKRAESLSLKTFLCERHEKPRGKSQGNPSKTRANSCKSYVSFKFTGDGVRKVCLVRKNGKHSGHSLDNRQEWKVNRIHPNLIDLITKLSREGLKKEEIVAKVKNWALKNQIDDCIDRRFYPTSQDIRYLMSRVPKKERTHETGEANTATTSKLGYQNDDGSCNVDNNSETSQKILGIGMKWLREDTDSFSYIILKKKIHPSHEHEAELVDPDRLASSLEIEPNIKTSFSSMNPDEEPTASTMNLISSSSTVIPQTSSSNIFASNTQASLDDVVPTPPSADILLSLASQQILPPVPQTLSSKKDSNILTISSSAKVLTPTPAREQRSLNQDEPKVGIPFFAESAQSTNELPSSITESNISSTERASSQILLPQFVEIASPVKLISATSDNGQLLAPKRFSSSNMIATNFTTAPASITMATDEALPISIGEISPSTVTISLSKGDSSLSTVGLTLSSDGLLLTTDGIPFTTDSILTTNQDIETSGRYTEEISSTSSLPFYTLHYNNLRDDSSTVSYPNSKPANCKDEANLEENNSSLEANASSKKRSKEFTEIVRSIVDSPFLSTAEDPSCNRADCLQQTPQNPSGDIEQNPGVNSSELPATNEEPHSQKNRESVKEQKQLAVEKPEKCSSEDKILILANETSKNLCLVEAKNTKGKIVKLSLTDARTPGCVKRAAVKDPHQIEDSQSKQSKQQPKNKLKSHVKRTKSDSLLEQPLKKRKVLSQIRPISDKHKKKGSPVSNNIHTQLKRDNTSGKKIFSYTTPLLLYNISQGRLHRLSITEDEMRRRTSPPEKLNLRALQALLQTHKKKQWKQNLKNKMMDSSITVNEGQSGYLTAFTRLSEEEASHLEFELLKMVANPKHVKINNIVQELVTEAIPSIETEKKIQAKNYLKNLEVTRQTLDEIYKKFLLHSENFSLITHTFGTSCMGVMKSVFDDILKKTMQRTKEEIGNV